MDNYALLDIINELKRIADALEESNEMIKENFGKVHND